MKHNPLDLVNVLGWKIKFTEQKAFYKMRTGDNIMLYLLLPETSVAFYIKLTLQSPILLQSTFIRLKKEFNQFCFQPLLLFKSI
jgi:hypothetical protein